jgi:hypothetical protein
VQRTQPGQRIRPPLICCHLGLAAAGLVVWIVYVAADKDALAWIAFALLVPVALLGFTMLAIWLRRRRAPAAGHPVPSGGATGPGPTTAAPAEQRFPVPIVIGHGLLALVTVILVLLTAAGVGGS